MSVYINVITTISITTASDYNTTINTTTTTTANNNNSNNTTTACSCVSPNASAAGSISNHSQCCRWYVFTGDLEFLPPPLSPETLALLTSLYALVVVAALLANVLVVVVVVKTKMLRSFTDTFILSLAVSDLLVAGFNMPARLLGEVWNEWRLGLIACRLTEYLQGVTIVNNILTLTAIAIDRYLVICMQQAHGRRGLAGQRRRRWTIVGLVAVWVLSLLAVVPQLFMTRLDMRIKMDSRTRQITGRAWVCAEVFSGDKERRAYTLTIYACFYIVPMIIMGYAYGFIARRLWRRKKSIQHGEPPAVVASASTPATARVATVSVGAVGSTNTSNSNGSGIIRQQQQQYGQQQQQQRRSYSYFFPQSQIALARRRRVTVMMIALVLAFTILWLPFFSASLYVKFCQGGGGGGAGAGGGSGSQGSDDDHRFRAARDFLQLVGYSTCCVNPVIYCFFNSHFQDQLYILCCGQSGNQGHGQDEGRGQGQAQGQRPCQLHGQRQGQDRWRGRCHGVDAIATAVHVAAAPASAVWSRGGGGTVAPLWEVVETTSPSPSPPPSPNRPASVRTVPLGRNSTCVAYPRPFC